MLLRGDGSSNLDLEQAQNMRWLYLERCSTVKKLVNITASSIGTTTVFPHLECLQLEELANLEVICCIDGTIAEGSFVDIFKNLKVLRLKSLPVLMLFWKDTFQNSDAVSGFLQQIESLEIKDCEMMEQVFLWDIIDDEKNKSSNIGQESHHVKITFPKLEQLKLRRLPNLTTFCKGIESIEFPLLSEMSIFNCPKLKSLASSSTGNNNNNNHNSWAGISNVDYNYSLHLICPEKVAFGSLKKFKFKNSDYNSFGLWCDQIPIEFLTGLEKLSIYDCGSIRSLFSSSIVRNLINLECLKIKKCKKMIKVIEDEERLDACSGQSTICFFPNLKNICLRSLPELKSFCEWRCALELPSLQEVDIRFCPKIERLSLGSLTTPNLGEDRITIRPKDIDTHDLDSEITHKEGEDLLRDFNDTKDFNAVLQQVFFIFKKVDENKQKKKREEEKDNEDKEEEEEGEEKEEGEREEDCQSQKERR